MTTKAISEIRSVLNGINNVLNEFNHSQPKPGRKPFFNMKAALGAEYVNSRQSCDACGSCSGLEFHVRDEDWQAVWPDFYRGKGGDGGCACFDCFDAFAHMLKYDYELLDLSYVGTRNIFDLEVTGRRIIDPAGEPAECRTRTDNGETVHPDQQRAPE